MTTEQKMLDWLEECARYFGKRDTGGEDRAHWANVYNAENTVKIRNHIKAQSAEIERQRELLDASIADYNEAVRERDNYRAGLSKAKDASRFYADQNNWQDQDNSCDDPECCSPCEYIPAKEDGGETAKQTLAELEKMG